MSDMPVKIQFALISHTNSGKTTLARTLVGADIGEVRDAAHVTTFAQSHPLLTTTAGDALHLWDTPGFGDSVRLMKRLAMSGNPIGWLLREVVDRYRDRTFWLSQQALRTARDSADVVLYLVNASESPGDAGYLAAEMKILEWLDKPVLVLLNQMGRPRPSQEEDAEREHWRSHLRQYPIVKDVLALDAFARCWVHERIFYESVGKLIDVPKAAGYRRLVKVWEENNAQRFRESMHIIASQLGDAIKDRQPVLAEDKTLVRSALKAIGLGKNGARQQQDLAMGTLIDRLEHGIGQATARILALYKIDPSEAAKINARVRENFVIDAPLDKAQAGFLGAIISGAATGLSADLMAGGLTLGGGALVGGIVGALTFAGAAWGFNVTTNRDQPTVQFSDAFLCTLVSTNVLRYLAVIHFGRGRGNFIESESPDFWQSHVKLAVATNEKKLMGELKNIRSDRNQQEAASELEMLICQIVSDTLQKIYPGALSYLVAQEKSGLGAR